MSKKIFVVTLITYLSLIIIPQVQAQAVFSSLSSSLGVTAENNQNGAKVLSVSSSGRAFRFGLQDDDIVMTINGQQVKDAQSFYDLMNGVPRGNAVSITVIRDGKQQTVGRTAVNMGGMGRGMGGRQNRQFLPTYDEDENGWLDLAERNKARGYSAEPRPASTYRSSSTVALSPDNVQRYTEDTPLYDLQTIRTIFLEFENGDWETELEYFYHTDVEVPAKMTVDGKVYENVGVRFRGNTSYSQSRRGYKRPLNLSVDFLEDKQYLYGYRTLNLLTSGSDSTFTRQILYSYIARQYIPALKANYVRLVINGENWCIYINYQQFNTDFVKDEFDTRKGARWKIPQMSGGSLNYLGDNIESYKRSYEIKSKDDPNSWAALANLCKILNQTPSSQLEEALEPILDIDEALRFLAIDKALVNEDGYWTRASDFLLYQDKEGRFHVFPYDTSETMSSGGGGGRGGFGGMGGGGVNLAPLANNAGGPLLSRLMAVPALQQRYLGYVRDIAENWLDWDKISPLATQLQSLIADDIAIDNRKLSTTQAFTSGLSGSSSNTLQYFIERRGSYLLGQRQVSEAPLPEK